MKPAKVPTYSLRTSRAIKRAFTLIELLIVVGIIAILALIAVPNFLEAQVRAKISRSKSDLRMYATAIEAYAADSNRYPADILPWESGPAPYAFYYWYLGPPLSTPIAYLTTMMLPDPFRRDNSAPFIRGRYVNYALGEFNATVLDASIDPESYNEGKPVYGQWRLSYAGPDGKAGPGSPVQTWIDDYDNWGRTNFPRVLVLYDPTNGSVSPGDIVRSQANSDPHQLPYRMN